MRLPFIYIHGATSPTIHSLTWVADAGVGVYPVLTPLGVVGHALVARAVIDVHSAVSASEPRGTVAGVVCQEVLSEDGNL